MFKVEDSIALSRIPGYSGHTFGVPMSLRFNGLSISGEVNEGQLDPAKRLIGNLFRRLVSSGKLTFNSFPGRLTYLTLEDSRHPALGPLDIEDVMQEVVYGVPDLRKPISIAHEGIQLIRTSADTSLLAVKLSVSAAKRASDEKIQVQESVRNLSLVPLGEIELSKSRVSFIGLANVKVVQVSQILPPHLERINRLIKSTLEVTSGRFYSALLDSHAFANEPDPLVSMIERSAKLEALQR